VGTSAIQCTATPSLRRMRAPFTERGALRLLVRNDSFLANFWDSIRALASPAAKKTQFYSNHFLRGAEVARVRIAGRHLGASFFLHCSLVALLIYLPHAIPADARPLNSKQLHAEIIYYRVPPRSPGAVPRIAPAGPGGRPGFGSISDRLPALGSTAAHPNLTIISKPARPDNFRQTIYQPNSPPDLRITTDQKLPNIVLGAPSEMPKAPLNPVISKPKQASHDPVSNDAPSVVARTGPAAPLSTFLKPSENMPKLAIPLAGGGAPVQRSATGSQEASGGSSSDAAGLVVLGVDPSGPTDQITLPGGNRWGEFTIAPPTGGGGSPGGDPNGVIGGGSGGAGSGGDGSTGIGSGGGGGGGGHSGNSGPISISGKGTAAGGRGGGAGGSGGSGGLLDSALLASMVYPVEASLPTIRKNTLVVSAGPIGGGGTNVYGALSCGKIYSIFLPMPEKNWSLQYCVKKSQAEGVASDAASTVIHLDKPLLPPDADLSHRFDFKRVAVAPEKSHRSIVLKGSIAIDGTVEHLVVYQGVTPEMDEAARLAFSKWHFRPAMKDGKPVEVEILVGIPPLKGEDRVTR
jgi:TonB-like protein